MALIECIEKLAQFMSPANTRKRVKNRARKTYKKGKILAPFFWGAFRFIKKDTKKSFGGHVISVYLITFSVLAILRGIVWLIWHI